MRYSNNTRFTRLDARTLTFIICNPVWRSALVLKEKRPKQQAMSKKQEPKHNNRALRRKTQRKVTLLAAVQPFYSVIEAQILSIEVH
jgi:hypothetical protein